MTQKLNTINKEHSEEERKLGVYKEYLEEKVNDLQQQVLELKSERDKEKYSLANLREKYESIDSERQKACGAVFEAYAEMSIAKEQAAMGEKARAEVERLNREILLLGELQVKYQERLAEAEKNKLLNVELDMLEMTYKEELRGFKSKTDSNKTLIEAYRQRIADLEGILSQKDEGIAQLKKSLMEVNAENYEKLKAMESKYKTQLSINRALEQKMLQLYTKIELPGLRSLHSPETSSCHEAIASASISGLSPHSSPLSASLASSESSNAFLSSDIKDMKNLQVLVDRKAGKLDDSIESAGDTMEMLQQPSTSTFSTMSGFVASDNYLGLEDAINLINEDEGDNEYDLILLPNPATITDEEEGEAEYFRTSKLPNDVAGTRSHFALE
ncbi:hypothetical protein HHI36_018936 [Cryptolaemus montrouzieri]|uniref:Uncharacterized protein n=1 Tax=Cryptolaemus montrouzieri TaxID=559131 RepID=A0ABD2P2J0_9CUCU